MVWEIFTKNDGNTKNDGKPEVEGLFFTGWDGKFLKSLDIVGRGVLTALFYEDPPLPTLPPFSHFVQPFSPSLPYHLQPPPPLFFLLSCFFG